VRVVNLGDRSDIFLDQSFSFFKQKTAYEIAVRFGEQWRFYDPASTYVPFGMLRWQEESQPAMLSDPKEPVWLNTPISGPEKSKQKRTATLRLSDDGTIEGDVRIEYFGHSAVERKEWDDDDSPAQREETLRNREEQIARRNYPRSDRTSRTGETVSPYYHPVPGYAQRTENVCFCKQNPFEHELRPSFRPVSTNAVFITLVDYDEVNIRHPRLFTQ
jgi:hypothetical protein